MCSAEPALTRKLPPQRRCNRNWNRSDRHRRSHQAIGNRHVWTRIARKPNHEQRNDRKKQREKKRQRRYQNRHTNRHGRFASQVEARSAGQNELMGGVHGFL